MIVDEAFDTLLKIAQQELEKAKRDGASYFANGDIARVRDTASQTEKIQSILSELQHLQKRWGELKLQKPPAVVRPQIREIYTRTSPHKKTPQVNYRIPILQTLVEMGGGGPIGPLLERVKIKMKDVLNDFDMKILPSGHNVQRWRNTAMWTRNDMVREGLMKKDSPMGIWEITDEGRKYLLKHS